MLDFRALNKPNAMGDMESPIKELVSNYSAPENSYIFGLTVTMMQGISHFDWSMLCNEGLRPVWTLVS
jgi:hypothetical protein